MFFQNRLSTTPVFAAWREPVRSRKEPLIDYEIAGVAINDNSQGLMSRQWMCKVVRDETVDPYEWSFVATALGTNAEIYRSSQEVTEMAFAFDISMNPVVAFTRYDGACFLRWFDNTANDFVLLELPAGSRNPRLCIDEKRPSELANSDVILSYIRGDSLYFRMLRERYATEHLLRGGLGPDAELVCVQGNTLSRLQFQFLGAIVGDDVTSRSAPLLSDIVTDLLERSGLDRQSIDVSQLYDEVVGYKVATQAGSDVLLQPLRSARFFDVSEYDKKIRFPKRGGPSVASLTVDDYLETDGSPVNLERVQEAELLRKVNLTYIDPTASYGPMTQAAERRSNTVLAKAESNSELPITMSADEAATVATRRLKVAWGELHKGDFGVGVPWSRLTPADVIEVTDKRGVRFRMRVLSITEDSGQFSIEAIEDADWAYLSNAKGVTPLPPQSTTPGIIGDSQIVIMNLPSLSSSHNMPGVYIAAYGAGAGWVGAEFWLSADGGQTYQPIGGIDIPATVGTLDSAITATTDPFDVTMQSGELSSATQAQLDARQNAIAIGTSGVFEIAQFANATENSSNQYTLDTVSRGLLETPPASHGAGDPIVLLDDAVAFCPIDVSFAGQSMLIKPVSFGQTLDEVTAVPFTYQPPTYILDGGGA